jgi:microcystin-dependent protein
LTSANLPAHNHTATFANNGSSLNVATTKATAAVPAAGSVLARSVDGSSTPSALPLIYAPAGTTAATALGGVNVAGTVTVGATGSSQPFNNVSPYLTVSVVIALFGIFPSRN